MQGFGYTARLLSSQATQTNAYTELYRHEHPCTDAQTAALSSDTAARMKQRLRQSHLVTHRNETSRHRHTGTHTQNAMFECTRYEKGGRPSQSVA